MALRTVRVPEAMAPLFERAEQVVSAYFRERADRPEHGTIEIMGERYVLVRAAALSVEFFQTVRDLLGPGREAEGDDFARTILFDLAHAVGRNDARDLHQKMSLTDPLERLSLGPIHFAHAGWAFVELLPESVVGDGGDYHLVYDHPYSFESDAWLRSGRRSRDPVCVMNAGYSSGWCEASFGIELLATEVLCRARGDACCRFVMAPPDRLEASVARYGAAHESHAAITPMIPEIFARKRLEDDLRAARSELERRVEERTLELRRANERVLREMTERATIERMLVQSQKMEALGQLAGGIAHDFNNLLTAIGGYAELLLDQVPGEDPRRRYALEIVNNTQRAARLTQQLLVFSRQEVFTPTVVDVPTVVEGLAVLLRRLIGEDVRLRVTYETGPMCVRMDRNQLETVLINLVVNARDAMMPHGGDLDVEIDAPDDDLSVDLVEGPADVEWLRIQVRDTGCGMDSETLSRAFEPFFTTKELGHGTGLGLATVYGIVQHARGQIHAESAVGQGTTMTLLLPRVHATPDAAGRSDHAGELPQLRGATVLVVEDEVVVREFLAQVLTRRGCRVLAASDADQARGLFARAAGGVDLVVCDVILPGGSGPALIEALRAGRPELPVLYVSGYTGDRIDPGQLRGASFLQKPFTVGQLLSEVERALAAAR